jgi:stage IV sporulation protein FB
VSLIEPTPTRLDVHFHLFGAPVRVSAWFWVLPGVIGAVSALYFGAPFFFLAPACFFGSILVHEFGHIFAGRYSGHDGYVVLNGFGGVAVGSADVTVRWRRVVVFAAGPMAQLLLGGLLWGISALVLPLVPRTAPIREALVYTLTCLAVVSLTGAFVSLLPVWPLDGWHIASEVYDQLRSIGRAPWYRDANWWKRGSLGPLGVTSSCEGSNRLPLTILLVAVLLAFAWRPIVDRFGTSTATDLMHRYKVRPDGADLMWQIWPETFRGVLRKPPWEKALYQYEGGQEALVYFVTDNPGEWIF